MNGEARFALASWLAAGAVDGTSVEALLAGFCARLNGAGLALLRVALTLESLDPVESAHGYRWQRRDGEAVRESFERVGEAADRIEGWRTSPFYVLYHGAETRLRRRLDVSGAAAEFPIFRDLAAAGATDYLATKAWFGRRGAGKGILASWTTDRPGGFSDDDLATLEALLPALELAVLASALADGVATVLATYLGRDAADRILDGVVERGAAHTLDAVLWASDLAGFTRLTDSEARDRVIELLNAYAERTCDAIEAAGGEVLKFAGDGTLAVFDRARLPDAPARALGAAVQALDAARTLGAERQAAGLPASALRVALHCGEVFYGNIGARTRLDFTVIGPAVNEAARLCDMCKAVERDLVVSSAFHAVAGPARARLVGLGRYALRGVRRPQHLYTLDTEGAGDAG